VCVCFLRPRLAGVRGTLEQLVVVVVVVVVVVISCTLAIKFLFYFSAVACSYVRALLSLSPVPTRSA
jgi:hypothetical protein